MAEPAIAVECVYHEPIEEGSITYEVTGQDPKMLSALNEVRASLDTIIERKREVLGFDDIRPINLSQPDAEKLRHTIKSDPTWLQLYAELGHLLVSELAMGRLLELTHFIDRPWWNSCLVGLAEDRYDPAANTLAMSIGVTHSYRNQLMRSGEVQKADYQPVSISNVLVSADNKIVEGLRGGHNLRETVMSVPAGSIDFHTGADPVFETIYAEHMEEVGLGRGDLLGAELIGKLNGFIIKGWPHYVTRTRTGLSFTDVQRRWSQSMDQREHLQLMSFPNEVGYAIMLLKTNTYDRSLTNPASPSEVAEANKGKILPQCGGALVAHFLSDNPGLDPLFKRELGELYVLSH